MELAINQLIKLVIGLAVIIAVVGGVYLFGKYIMGSFENLPTGQAVKTFMVLVK